MRTVGWTILLATGVLSVVGASIQAKGPATKKAASESSPGPFVVHEWGTFTNFAGSDGAQLEFRPSIDEHLPAFVYDRNRWAFHPLFNPFSKRTVKARQRMETPVTYFYTDRQRTLDVRVDFPRGLLTEFYPPANEMTPPLTAEGNDLKQSSLTWQVKLHPMAEKSGKLDGPPDLLEVAGDDHYGFARETDSAVVEVNDHFGYKHGEKFLFYRGVGNFELPLRLEALGNRRFEVVNDSSEEIESLFMVMIDEKGVHFGQHPRLAAGARLEMEVTDSPSTADELGGEMAEALVAAGLYPKEATAMVHTWQSSWFSEPGARLFYFVPRRLTDEIIPLNIEPAPDQMVRVLVGRMETLTPEAAGSLVARIRDLGTCLSAEAEPLAGELSRLGRFAEPALSFMSKQEKDPALREAIEQVRAKVATAVAPRP